MTNTVAKHCKEKFINFDVLQNAKILEVVRNRRPKKFIYNTIFGAKN